MCVRGETGRLFKMTIRYRIKPPKPYKNKTGRLTPPRRKTDH